MDQSALRYKRYSHADSFGHGQRWGDTDHSNDTAADSVTIASNHPIPTLSPELLLLLAAMFVAGAAALSLRRRLLRLHDTSADWHSRRSAGIFALLGTDSGEQ
jgi:hypothetical protein